MGSEETFQMLEDILTELVALFPSPYFHLGGDEGNWSLCAKHAEKLGLNRADEAAAWKRMRDFLAANDRRMVTWSRGDEFRVMKSPVFQYWSYEFDAKQMTQHIESSADVYVSPIHYCYLDHGPKPAKDGKPGASTLREFYLMDPVPAGLPPETAAHVLGGEDCMWGSTPDEAIFPRLCATAEALWSPLEKKDFEDFMKRMKTHYDRLNWMGVRCGPSGMEP
jgi:hexosaminidase